MDFKILRLLILAVPFFIGFFGSCKAIIEPSNNF